MTKVKRPARLGPRERSALAKRVEAIYAFERNNWHRMRGQLNHSDADNQRVRYWSRSSKRSSVWSTLAELFHFNRICIHTYIYYVFFLPEFIQRPPTPNEIYPHQRLSEFEESVEAKTQNLAWQFSYYGERMKSEIVMLADMYEGVGTFSNDNERETNATLSVLLCDSQHIPAIYRYAAGWQLHNTAVRKAAVAGAAIEYSRHQKSYDSAWPFLPSELRKHLLQSMDGILKSETGISISFSESGK